MPATAITKPKTSERIAAEVCVGKIIGRTVEGYPIVRFHGNVTGQKIARTTISLDDTAGFSNGALVLVVFENRDPDLPIIVGRLSSADVDITIDEYPRSAKDSEFMIPGKQKIVLEAQQEIVLRCGRSSLTLQRDGRIIVRGRDLISRASRRNRIQGGSVNIN